MSCRYFCVSQVLPRSTQLLSEVSQRAPTLPVEVDFGDGERNPRWCEKSTGKVVDFWAFSIRKYMFRTGPDTCFKIGCCGDNSRFNYGKLFLFVFSGYVFKLRWSFSLPNWNVGLWTFDDDVSTCVNIYTVLVLCLYCLYIYKYWYIYISLYIYSI